MAASFKSPFEALQLAPREIIQLDELACTLVAQVVGEFEEHMADPSRAVDTSRWKLVKEREDVHVYRHRHDSQRRARPGETTPHRYSTDSRDTSGIGQAEGESSGQADAQDLPILLTVGTIQSDLYDAMYAVTNPTTKAMRIKTAYIQDGMIDSAVLARLRDPTTDDPFRSLTVKWCITGQARHLRTLVGNRDLVYLEATGLTRLPRSGELIGYQLLHSVNFPQTHPIQGCTRGNMSIIGLYRQHGHGSVEMFGKGFVDPTGHLVHSLVVKSAADAMLSTWRTVQTAQLKKLAYALRRRQRERRSSSARPSDGKVCAICSKALSFMAALSFGKKGYASHCQLCLRTVCTSCRVKKELASIAPDGWLDMQQIPFCLACIDSVAKTSAFDIAHDEFVPKTAPRSHSSRSLASSVGPRSKTEWSGSKSQARYA